ncbi:MAG TPA: long-chain fatty acid--CoA ligase [Nitrospiraceae bacterium]|nr:long-chain fatty acid--CoA ligase [Nitrospiraceae bacterium]
MIETISMNKNIQEAHRNGTPLFQFPFTSFAQFFHGRVADPDLMKEVYLTYYDDSGMVRSYTYEEFGNTVNRTVTFLREQLGVHRGDRIAILLFNHDFTVVMYYAAWVLGAVVVPIDINESEDRRFYILEHSEARVAFCWGTEYQALQDIRNRLPQLRHVVSLGNGNSPLMNIMGQPCPTQTHNQESLDQAFLQDEALIVYTSGTTGPPKGVVLTIENLLVDAHAIAGWHELEKGHCLMCVLPIHHVNGIVVTLITPFYGQGRSVLNRRFRQSVFWNRIQDEGVTCVSVVPTILEFLLEGARGSRKYRLDHFRGVICGAGPLLKDTVSRFEHQFHAPVRHGYGLSETTCYSSFLPVNLSEQEHRHWLTDYDYPSIGLPIPHNDMAILNPQGQPVGETEKGEICIRGQTVCSGYLKRPDANEESFRWGWFRSGDEGFFVRDQVDRPYFFISGRLKELIIRGGVNISPLEIDEVLRGHPSVQFGMAVSFENRFYGEEIAGYLVVKEHLPPPSENEIVTWCRKALPYAKCPKVIVFGQEVPYTTTGKPKRLELKARLSPTLARYRDVQFRSLQRGSTPKQQTA